MRTDWTPVLADPGGEPNEIKPLASDLDHARISDRPQRNGLPVPVPYRWRPGEAEREAELAERLEAIRAVAAKRVWGMP
jgi:hypothetical protein